MYALTNCTLYTGSCVLTGYGVVIEGDKIVAISHLAELPAAGSSGRFYELLRHLGKGLALLQANRLAQARHALAQAEVLALGFPHSAALPWVFHHQACLHWALGETLAVVPVPPSFRLTVASAEAWAMALVLNGVRARLKKSHRSPSLTMP